MATKMILPGVYIQVNAEGLISPGQVTVGNLGVIGTAARGPVGSAVVLGSYTEALQHFYTYDAWIDGNSNELTLVRALEQAFDFGATTVYAVRIASNSNAPATYMVTSASGNCVQLSANTPGTWGDDLTINVATLGAADGFPVISNEKHLGSEASPITLLHFPVIKSARNRVIHHIDATNVDKSLQIVYDGDPAPKADQLQINRPNGQMTFGDVIQAADTITATYLVDPSKGVKVTLQLDQAKETYIVVDGNDLVSLVNNAESGSAWVTGTAEAHSGELPSLSNPANAQAGFKGGDNGAITKAADYETGLTAILNEDAQIIVAAGQDDSFGAELDQHCQLASTDEIQRERIAVVGSRLGAKIDDLQGHTLDSDRVIFVAPGMQAIDAASGNTVTLPGAYTAAAVAGMLGGFPAQVSLTNKPLPVNGLEQVFARADLELLVEARILAVQSKNGFKLVKGITTTTDSAFSQITTRRIVDFAKFGVRSAADPFIGLLNNDRVRAALRASINSFLANMVSSEMLVSYNLDVSATRDQQIQGIAQVTMTLQPTFSIDYIVVTMFLQ
jgi:hypothetical protein